MMMIIFLLFSFSFFGVFLEEQSLWGGFGAVVFLGLVSVDGEGGRKEAGGGRGGGNEKVPNFLGRVAETVAVKLGGGKRGGGGEERLKKGGGREMIKKIKSDDVTWSWGALTLPVSCA